MPTGQNRPGDSLFRDDVRESLKRRLEGLTAGSEARWGTMTANQMICHLSDAYRVPIGERPARSVGSVIHRTLFKWVALHTSITWPKGITTAPDLAQDGAGTPPTDFDPDMTELLRLVGTFATVEGEGGGRTHPMFGPLTSWEWGRWGYRHADYHLRQFGA